MGKYVVSRIVKAIVSLIIVIAIVIAMLFKMVPITKAFDNDAAYRRLQGNEKTDYAFRKRRMLGYLDYYTMNTMCEKESENEAGCLLAGSEEQERVLKVFEDKGFTIGEFKANDGLKGQKYAYRNYGVFEILHKYMSKLIVADGKNAIQDPDNPDLERKLYWEKGYNGAPALACSGCKYKYQLYFNGSFPFIHSNGLHWQFGESYPTQEGIQTLDVINEGQGQKKKFQQTYPTGYEAKSADMQYTRKYKSKLSHIDEKKIQ